MEYDPNSEYVRKFTKWMARQRFRIKWVSTVVEWLPRERDCGAMECNALVQRRIGDTNEWETIGSYKSHDKASQRLQFERDAYNAAHGIIQTRPEDEVL